MYHNVGAKLNQFDLLRLVCEVMASSTSLNDTFNGILALSLPPELRLRLAVNVVRYTQVERMQTCHFELALGVSLRYTISSENLQEVGGVYRTFLKVSEPSGEPIERYSYAFNGYPRALASASCPFYCSDLYCALSSYTAGDKPDSVKEPEKVIPFFLKTPMIAHLLGGDTDRMGLEWLHEHYPAYIQVVLDLLFAARAKDELQMGLMDGTIAHVDDTAHIIDGVRANVADVMSRVYVPDGLTKEMLVAEISNVFLQYSAVVTDSEDSGADETAGHTDVEMVEDDDELSMLSRLSPDMMAMVDEVSVAEASEELSLSWLTTPPEAWIEASELLAKSIDQVD